MSDNSLLALCRQAGLALSAEAGIASKQILLPLLEQLKKFELVSADNLVNEAIVEVIVRRVFADKHKSGGGRSGL